MKIVVVHGGGWNIDELMRRMGTEPRRYRGHRITDERTDEQSESRHRTQRAGLTSGPLETGDIACLLVDLEILKPAVTDKTILLSVMFANN